MSRGMEEEIRDGLRSCTRPKSILQHLLEHRRKWQFHCVAEVALHDTVEYRLLAHLQKAARCAVVVLSRCRWDICLCHHIHPSSQLAASSVMGCRASPRQGTAPNSCVIGKKILVTLRKAISRRCNGNCCVRCCANIVRTVSVAEWCRRLERLAVRDEFWMTKGRSWTPVVKCHR